MAYIPNCDLLSKNKVAYLQASLAAVTNHDKPDILKRIGAPTTLGELRAALRSEAGDTEDIVPVFQVFLDPTLHEPS